MTQRLTILIVVLVGFGVLAFARAQSDRIQLEAYGPGYDGGAAMLRDIRDELRALRADMRLALGQGSGNRLVSNVNDVIKARCASCHSESSAAEKGGEFVMTRASGEIMKLGPLETRIVKRKVKARQMPPGGGLSETEIKAFDTLNGETK